MHPIDGNSTSILTFKDKQKLLIVFSTLSFNCYQRHEMGFRKKQLIATRLVWVRTQGL